MIPFSIIVAMDEDNGIGRQGKLPWHLAGDLKHFKEITSSAAPGRRNAVIMGRKTWESIPEKFRPLPGRLNVVVTRSPERSFPEGVLKCGSLEQALERLASDEQFQDTIGAVYVIGGGEIYREALRHPDCRMIYATKVSGRFSCDTFFPDFSGDFREKTVSPRLREGDVDYAFAEFVRLAGPAKV